MQFFGFPLISLSETSVIPQNPGHPPMPSNLEYLLRQLARLPPQPPPFGPFGRSVDLAGPLGRFGCLPTEINFMIFACLPLDDVGNFALTSKSTKALAASYLTSRACLRRVLSLPSKMAEVNVAYCYSIIDSCLSIRN